MNSKKAKRAKRGTKTYRMRERIRRSLFFINIFCIIIICGIIALCEHNGVTVRAMKNPPLALMGICGICFIMSAFGAYLVTNQIFGPLERINGALRQVSKGNYSALTYDGKIKELRETVDGFNLMVKELNSVEMIRSDFIANVSHEFRTPLSSISGYVTLLQDPDLTAAEKEEYIRKIFFNIEKLNDLTANILQISKLENQGVPSAPERYRLDEQIREAIVLLEPKWSAKSLRLDIDLQEVYYVGQRQLMLQVWLNIIGNAVKFTDEGGEIAVRLSKTGRTVKASVADDGIGMTAETRRHIFEKFYQGDTSRRSQGNGLGLALCKEILDSCGGRIEVSSEPGHGAAFMITLEEHNTNL